MNKHARNFRFIFPILVILFLLRGSALAGDLTGAKGASSMSLSIHSAAFANGAAIPKKFTCSGEDQSPMLEWGGAPPATKSFALIVDDPDAPGGMWVHWVIFNIPATSAGLHEGTEKKDRLPDGTRQGRNDFGKIGYNGPCPPPGRPHRYFFKLYALNAELGIAAGAGKAELERAMDGHILAKAEWVGKFGR